MADRTVTVRLRTDYDGTGVRRATGDYEKFSRTASSRMAATNKGLKTMSTGLLAVGGVAAAGVGEAIKSFASFDAKMSTTAALAHASAGDMESLRKAALSVGRSYGISAGEAADAEQELVKAGISVRDILGGGLKGALTLAAAGQIDVGKAAEIATQAMTQFSLAGKDMPHVADLLAAGADKALGGVGDLGDGLSQVGTTAHQMNLTIEDTVGVLAEFANAGLIGSRGGTTLKQFLLQLAAPTHKAAELMKQYGLSLYDANGQMKTMPEIAGNLQKSFQDLTPAQRNSALATIFGSRAVQAANILYKEGAKGTQGWIDRVNASGFASEQASAKLNNLEGDLQKLKVAFNTAFIEAGSGGNEFARGLVQGVTRAINAFDDLSPATQHAVLSVTAITAATGLVGGGLLRMVVRVNEAREAMTAFAASSRAAGLAVSGLKVGGAVLAGLAVGAAVVQATKVNVDGYAKSIENAGGASQSTSQKIRALRDDLAKQQAVLKGSHMFADGYGVSWTHSGRALKAAYDRSAELRGEISRLQNVSRDAAAAQDVVNRALAGGKVSATELAAAYQKLSNDAQSVEGANLNFRQSLQDLSASVKDNGRSLSQNTAKGIVNRQALLAAAQAAVQLRDSVQQTTGSTQKANTVFAASRAMLVGKVVSAFHLSKAAADHYVTSVLGIPPVKRTNIKENARTAKGHVDALQRALNGLHDKNIHIHTFASKSVITSYAHALAGLHDKTVRITTVHAGRKGDIGDLLNPTPWRGGLVARYKPTIPLAMGGFAGPVSGPGGPTDDAAGLFALSNEEYVTRAWATRQMRKNYGDGVMDYINTYGRMPGLAGGGVVQGSRYAPAPQITVTAPAGGGQFTGTLVADTGAFLGMINGQINATRQRDTQRAHAGSGRVR